MKFEILSSAALGKRPVAVNNLNGESFQQDNLLTYNGKPITHRLTDFRLAVLCSVYRPGIG